MNAVCPVPAASTARAIASLPSLWLPGVRRSERFSNISSKSPLGRAGTHGGFPPGEGSRSLPSCGAGPWLLRVSGHCLAALVPSAEAPPTRSAAACGHQTGGQGTPVTVGAAAFSPLCAVLQAGDGKARCERLSSASIARGKPCRRPTLSPTLSRCAPASRVEMVTLKCPVSWACALTAWPFILLSY